MDYIDQHLRRLNYLPDLHYDFLLEHAELEDFEGEETMTDQELLERLNNRCRWRSIVKDFINRGDLEGDE